MIETLSVFQWSILALAALCIGMSKNGVQDRHRSLAWNPYGKTLPRKSLPKIHPDCHNTLCSNDARLTSHRATMPQEGDDSTENNVT